MAANDSDSDYDYMRFWANYKQMVPTWFTVLSDAVLLQPSSAFMEMLFSTSVDLAYVHTSRSRTHFR